RRPGADGSGGCCRRPREDHGRVSSGPPGKRHVVRPDLAASPRCIKRRTRIAAGLSRASARFGSVTDAKLLLSNWFKKIFLVNQRLISVSTTDCCPAPERRAGR